MNNHIYQNQRNFQQKKTPKAFLGAGKHVIAIQNTHPIPNTRAEFH